METFESSFVKLLQSRRTLSQEDVDDMERMRALEDESATDQYEDHTHHGEYGAARH